MPTQIANSGTDPQTIDLLGNKDLEKRLVSVLMAGIQADEIFTGERLDGSCFYDKHYGRLFDVLKERYLLSKPLSDYSMIAEEMQKKGEKNFTDISLISMLEAAPPMIEAEEYIRTIKDLYKRRTLKDNLKILWQNVFDREADIGQVICKTVDSIFGDENLATQNIITLSSTLKDFRQRIDDNRNGRVIEGLPTGFSRLDVYGGLHPGDLVIVGANSSEGKTAFSLNIVMNALMKTDVRALIFSMEMRAMQLTGRIMSAETGIPASAFIYKRLSEKGLEVTNMAMDRLRAVEERLYFGASSEQSMDKIAESVRMHHLKYGVRLVMIDYAQIISVPPEQSRDGREAALAWIARKCKNICNETGICIILISQINREAISQNNPEPSAQRIRGSGEINEASDLTLMIYRPEKYHKNFPSPYENEPTKGRAMIKVEKDRNGGYGGEGSFIVNFDGATTRFYE